MEENKFTDSRRDFLKASAGTGLAVLGSVVSAQRSTSNRISAGSVRYKSRSEFRQIPHLQQQRRASRQRHALGRRPVWFGDGRYLLVSDIPNNRIMRYDEATGTFGVFRHPANFPTAWRAIAKDVSCLRTPDAQRDAHRLRRQDHRTGRQVQRQAAELAQ